MTMGTPGGPAPPAPASVRGGGKINVGGVVAQTFAVLGRNIVPFLILAALLNLLPLAAEYALFSSLLGQQPDGSLAIRIRSPSKTFLIAVLTRLASLFATLLLAAALAPGVLADLEGHRLSTRACLFQGLAALVPGFTVAIAVGMAVSVGLILLIVPGVVVAIVLFTAMPAAVAERAGVVASMRRSGDLTAGNSWRILGALAILWICVAVVQWVVGSLALVALPGVFVWLGQVFAALSVMLLAVASSVTYRALRSATEGAPTAGVFD